MNRAAFVIPMVGLIAACGGPSIPDPKEAVRAYADAAARGDADAIYGMMSEKSRRALTAVEVRRLVAEERAELAEQAKSATAPEAAIQARAKVEFADGESATLVLDPDGYRIAAADALPAGARTPAEALAELRRVLARRSYAGLVRTLTPASRAALEGFLRSLVVGLEEPESLDIDVTGDSASVEVPGGHRVRLKREAGIWRIDDFD